MELDKSFLKEINKGLNANLTKFDENNLYDLIDEYLFKGFISGISLDSPTFDDSREIQYLGVPRLTKQGHDFFNSLDKALSESIPKIEIISPDLYHISSHLQGLNEGQRDMLKLMAEHIEALDEIRFLTADQVTIMKEKLIKLRDSDNEKKVSWDTLINLTSLIVSVSSKVG